MHAALRVRHSALAARHSLRRIRVQLFKSLCWAMAATRADEPEYAKYEDRWQDIWGKGLPPGQVRVHTAPIL
jgi:hypothetical protein